MANKFIEIIGKTGCIVTLKMNCSINILCKSINQLSRNSTCFSFKFKTFSKFSKTFLKADQNFFFKQKKNSLIFIRKIRIFSGSTGSFKKEKLSYNGIRRLLALAAPEKYKLMGMLFLKFAIF